MKRWQYLIPILFCCTAAFFAYRYVRVHSGTAQKEPLSPVLDAVTTHPAFSLEQAPSSSLRATIATMSGDVRWQGRMATEAAVLVPPVTLQQGEKLVVGEKGAVTFAFQDACTVTISANTTLEIVQTLPATIVFVQTGGVGTYETAGAYPISIRSTNSIIQNSGTVTITYDEKKPTVLFSQTLGTSILAYNDAAFVSQEITIPAGHAVTFNYDTRKAVLR